MRDEALFTLTRKGLFRALLFVIVLCLVFFFAQDLAAQKIQDTYSDKFKVATEDGGIAITTSADGRYVFIAGKRGMLVSDDYGKTGSWTQTLRLK